jgi:hypothetical protein
VVILFRQNQMLVGPVVIDAELGKEDHISIPATAFEKGLEPFNAKTCPEL